MQPTFDYALTDLTNLYNNPRGARDVTHASRSIIWLKPDIIVVYDRATTGTTGRFKKFNLWLPTNPAINGHQATMTSPGGQKLFITSLQAPNQTLTAVPAENGISMIAEADPMQYKLVIQDPANPTNIRFLTVLQGADAGAAAAPLAGIQSSAGTAFSGVEVQNTAILFPVDIRTSFANVTFATAAATNRYMVTGLTPNAAYDTTIRSNAGGMQITVAPGTQCRADSGGVLDFGPGAPRASVKPRVQSRNAVHLSGKSSILICDTQGRLVQRRSTESSAGAVVGMTRTAGGLPAGVYICALKTGGKVTNRRFVQVNYPRGSSSRGIWARSVAAWPAGDRSKGSCLIWVATPSA
jgi:hypothetical protein